MFILWLLIPFLWAAVDPNYRIMIPLNVTNGGTVGTQFQVRIDTYGMRTRGQLLSASCWDLEFYDGTTKVAHWLETPCAAGNGILTNIWLNVSIGQSATKSLRMYVGNPTIGGPTEVAWSGKFVVPTITNCTNLGGGWSNHSAINGYFPVPSATAFGTVTAGTYQTHTHTFPSLQTTSTIDSSYQCNTGGYYCDRDTHFHTLSAFQTLGPLTTYPKHYTFPFCENVKFGLTINNVGMFTGNTTSLPTWASPLSASGVYVRGGVSFTYQETNYHNHQTSLLQTDSVVVGDSCGIGGSNEDIAAGYVSTRFLWTI